MVRVRPRNEKELEDNFISVNQEVDIIIIII